MKETFEDEIQKSLERISAELARMNIAIVKHGVVGTQKTSVRVMLETMLDMFLPITEEERGAIELKMMNVRATPAVNKKMKEVFGVDFEDIKFSG